jgi:tol-pal system protein YbgF
MLAAEPARAHHHGSLTGTIHAGRAESGFRRPVSVLRDSNFAGMEGIVRIRMVIPMVAALLLAAAGGALLAPPPAGGVSKEIIELQQQVSTLMQNQQDMRSAMDQQNGALKVLVEQSLDSVNKLSGNMDQLQKSVQEVNATAGARVDSLSTQTQAISDNLQVVQSRVGKLSDQMTDLKNLLQSVDAKVSGGAPSQAGTGGPSDNSATVNPNQTGGQPNSQSNDQGSNPGNDQPNGQPDNSQPAGQPSGPPSAEAQPGGGTTPPSAEVLYTSALRDFSGGNYDLAQQEFTDYLKNFPDAQLASNARFYMGEIDFVGGNYHGAIAQYNNVINNYPDSFKAPAAHLKKGEALIALKLRTSGLHEFHTVVEMYPGTDEARRAQEKLRQYAAPR